MSQFKEKEVIQAVLVANNNVNLRPLSDEMSTALIPLVNVPLLDYALESLNRSGIEEIFIFSSSFTSDVRRHIKQRIEEGCTWSIDMKVHVIGAEGTLGDALRDLDGKGLIRGYFILMGTDTVTNAKLLPILEQHKKTAKFDKGASLTIVLKEDSSKLRIGDQIIIAMDADSKRLQYHQRIIQQSLNERTINMPLEIFLNNSNVAVHHNLIDPQIAICSPSFLPLFSDNFDFQNRDDFIRELLINEEILDSRVYVHLLPHGQYARKISNWITYQIVSNDVINRWAYPLVPDMGICNLWQNYCFLKNNIYKSPKANILKVNLQDNIVIQAGSSIDDGSDISCVVLGKMCKIGKNCILKNSFLFDNVILEDNCILEYCVVGSDVLIGKNSTLSDGTVVGSDVVIPENSKLTAKLLQKNSIDDQSEKIGDKAYLVNDEENIYVSDSDDDEQLSPIKTGILKMKKISFSYEESHYNSSSDEEDCSKAPSPVLDDTNIFLSEVIDSLTRGFQDKSKPDCLILEINSSRYAYNMTLKEVNFNVIKAILSVYNIQNNTLTKSGILQNLLQILKYFEPIISNYIKTKDAMSDCLKAIEEYLNKHTELREKSSQIIHYFYDKEFLSEDVIISWYEELSEESQELKKNLTKLIEWLMASSEEESSGDSD